MTNIEEFLEKLSQNLSLIENLLKFSSFNSTKHSINGFLNHLLKPVLMKIYLKLMTKIGF